MLTRLKVNGFKNLVDVDVRFGPFTCIVGENGAGKSNLLDAIAFLAALAEKPLIDAALSVRGNGGRSADIRSLFHRVGDHQASEMSFEAEMIVPTHGKDELNRPITPMQTYLRYSLVLAYLPEDEWPSQPDGPLRIVREELVALGTEEVREGLGFPHDAIWRESVVRSDERRHDPLIWTVDMPLAIIALLESLPPALNQRLRRLTRIRGERADSDVTEVSTDTLPRSALSVATVGAAPEIVMARQEMRSWRVLHLDPTAMRGPDSSIAPARVGSRGEHLARTLSYLAETPPVNGERPEVVEDDVYARVSNRLYDLLGEVRDVTVERDDGRDELTLVTTSRDGTRHAARALSDGTLRILALAILEAEDAPGLLCIEEPENGVHPGRIQAVLDVLQAIAVDTRYPIEPGNPLRQVIVSTHAPSVVMRVPEDSIVVAELRDTIRDGRRFKRALFRGLANAWRDPAPSRDSLPPGALLKYLNPEGYRPLPRPDPERDPGAPSRITDRADVRRMLSPHPPT